VTTLQANGALVRPLVHHSLVHDFLDFLSVDHLLIAQLDLQQRL